jgi:hypothetical protein
METISRILWLFCGVAFVVTLALLAAYELMERWRKLPNFYWNRLGSRFALCSSGDFYVAKNKGRFIKTPGGRNLVVVDETACCQNDDRQFPPMNWLCPHSENAELFIPYASPSVVAPEGVSFLGSKEIGYEWIRTKEEQNKKLFWRMRAADYHNLVVSCLLVSALIVVCLFVFAGIGQLILVRMIISGV